MRGDIADQGFHRLGGGGTVPAGAAADIGGQAGAGVSKYSDEGDFVRIDPLEGCHLGGQITQRVVDDQ